MIPTLGDQVMLEIKLSGVVQDTPDAYCDECDWTGLASECDTYAEQETWETEPYMVAICPKCNGDQARWYNKEEVGYE